MGKTRAQLSVELVIIATVMVGLLLAMYIVNDSLRTSWEDSRQMLLASSAATQAAMAINRAAAGGNGTKITFFSSASPDVASLSVFDLRSVRAYTLSGRFASAPLVTNNTNFTAGIPLNSQVTLVNYNGQVRIG